MDFIKLDFICNLLTLISSHISCDFDDTDVCDACHLQQRAIDLNLFILLSLVKAPLHHQRADLSKLWFKQSSSVMMCG